MNTNEPTGRNEPCPCGSEKKFKVCCGRRPDIVPAGRRSFWLIGSVAVVGLVVVAAAAVRLGDGEPAEASRSFSPPAPLPAPIFGTPGSAAPLTTEPLDLGALAQPAPGSAPEGKVWSSEHGHYHDAPGAAPQVTAEAGGVVNMNPQPVDPGALTLQPGVPGASVPQMITPPASTPQPDGPVPEGKVWSAEHGHWHDAPGASPQVTAEAGGVVNMNPQPVDPGALTPQPGVPGAPVPQVITPPAPTPQPDGPVPEGKVWSTEHGHWHDAPPPVAPPPK